MTKTLGELLADPITMSDEEETAIRAVMDAARELESAANAARHLYGQPAVAASRHAYVHALEFHYGMVASGAAHEFDHGQHLLALARRT